MECYKIENLSFTYPDRCNKVLENLNITINQGEFVTICGKSGCGKTTLLRLLKSVLSPYGKTEGNIFFKGKPLNLYSTGEQAASIGFVMQNPDNQIVTDKVWHELAFGLESLGYSTHEIRMRVSEMASFFDIQSWFYKNVNELSGGQKQILNLASVMVMQPDVLILDEPTSQLDPISAQNFLKSIEKINRELGVSVILTEHRLEDAFPISDRVIVMEDGKIIADEKPEKIAKILKDNNNDMYISLPAPAKIYSSVENADTCPLTVREGRMWLEEYPNINKINSDIISSKKNNKQNNDAAIEFKDVWFRYEKNLPDVIKGLSLKIDNKEIFAIVGGNGTGKTSFLSLVSGINKPYRGRIYIKNKKESLYDGTLGVLPQNPQSIFIKKTVYLDLMDILSEVKISKEEKEKRIENIATLCKIKSLFNSHPYDLSGGEMQRCALAKILLKNPDILLLDEPTKGMDAHFKKEFGEILKFLKKNGVTIVMVSHDIEFCAEYADRCAMFFDGNITSMGYPREFFAGKSFYTTSANRMARNIIPNAILAEDIIMACGKATDKKMLIDTGKSNKNDNINPQQNNDDRHIIKAKKTNHKYEKRVIVSMLFILLLIPFTIYTGVSLLDDKKYYFISLLIILETMIPFCMLFEKKRPQARELVVISVLCAIAVASRGAFFMLPQFKPVVAIVMISGICFGGECGFLVGSVTGFVSNFFFGQGPWTPWQMFAFGIIGFITGLIFKQEFMKKTKIILCFLGFILTFAVYGGIMNFSYVIGTQTNPTEKMFASAYLSGIPFDFIHALSTAFFLWFLAEPMIEKIERIKHKYGLM